MLVEATLDFPEEEIDQVDREEAHGRLRRLQEEVDRRSPAAVRQRASQWASGRIGRPAQRRKIRRSSTGSPERTSRSSLEIPGTTRDAVPPDHSDRGVPMNIIDTAGLRDTVDAVEAIGIARTWKAIGHADALLLIVDARIGVTAADRSIVDRLPGKLKPVTVFNKIDLFVMRRGRRRTSRAGAFTSRPKTGDGIESLREALLKLAGWQSGEEDVFMARERHPRFLERVAQALDRAGQTMLQSELFAEELRLAQRELGSITGEFSADDLLGQIFARFLRRKMKLIQFLREI